MSLLHWLLVSLCLGWVAVVHAAPPEPNVPMGDQPPAATVPADPLKPESVEVRQAALTQRVMAKWDALIRRDFETAYSFTSPGYRKLFSLRSFKGGFGGKTAWQRIEVAKVDFEGDDTATVGIILHFAHYPPQAEKALDMKTYIKESWVRVDGQWWYLVEK